MLITVFNSSYLPIYTYLSPPLSSPLLLFLLFDLDTDMDEEETLLRQRVQPSTTDPTMLQPEDKDTHFQVSEQDLEDNKENVDHTLIDNSDIDNTSSKSSLASDLMQKAILMDTTKTETETTTLAHPNPTEDSSLILTEKTAVTATPPTPSPTSTSILLLSEDEYQPIIDASNKLYQQFLDLEPIIDEEMINLEESLARRQLYSKMELLRLDFNELPLVDAFHTEYGHATAKKQLELAKQLKSTKLGISIHETIAKGDELRKKMKVRPSPIPTAYKVFWMFSGAISILLLMPFLFPLSILRLLHGPLVAMGVPSNRLPIDLLQFWFTRVSIVYWGVQVIWENSSVVDPAESYIGMCTHQSSMDPWIMCAGNVSYRLIGKRSLFQIPLIGWLMTLWGHISIDRGNIEKAKKSFDRALKVLRKYSRSIGVFPEGTRTDIGRPCDLKKGVFHTAIQAKLPIVPVILLGMSELWPSTHLTTAPGVVTAKVLDPIPVLETDTYKTLMSKVHRALITGYAQPVIAEKCTTYGSFFSDFLSLPLIYTIIYYIWWR